MLACRSVFVFCFFLIPCGMQLMLMKCMMSGKNIFFLTKVLMNQRWSMSLSIVCRIFLIQYACFYSFNVQGTYQLRIVAWKIIELCSQFSVKVTDTPSLNSHPSPLNSIGYIVCVSSMLQNLSSNIFTQVCFKSRPCYVSSKQNKVKACQ